ncbi:hypothetical protein [Streptomyces sp. NPDC059575]|uniref:hypothetical protein n=1 Tax=Streptomyces sp. NPDC059575 TaxID=3346872 RepID=UPI0036B1F4A9
MSDRVYIALEDGYLGLESISGEGRMTLRLVAEPQKPEALEGEDEEFCLGSYGQLFLQDPPSPLPLTGVRAVVDEGPDTDDPAVRCIEFTFGGSQVLFADPSYYFGIRLEGVGAYERWLADHQSTLAPFGPWRELTWTP